MIYSMLDDDLYKFTMQQAVLHHYPNAEVTYKFVNRGTNTFSNYFINLLERELTGLEDITLTTKEKDWIKSLNIFSPSYIEYLSNYRYNTNQLKLNLDKGKLSIDITGPWHKTILWEVKLMAIVSELYFSEYKVDQDILNEQRKLAVIKGNDLSNNSCKYIDFGTRRRRSGAFHEKILKELKTFSGFVGTSNLFFAKNLEVKPVGTMAHEWIQAISVLESLNHANRYALKKWAEVYKGKLGIALSDTFGTDSFLKDFDNELARLYDGVRQDSGHPITFSEKITSHYRKLGIDPMTKTVVFSDSLNVEKVISIYNQCKNKHKCLFGIGTNFTNDFKEPALNMVIKLWSVNGINVAKLSDDITKATGDKQAIELARLANNL